jgi:NADP-dependent 3-hydroxy acid dehydrogenase YdfG
MPTASNSGVKFNYNNSTTTNSTKKIMLLQGKNAIVTGSNRGIGKAIVEIFAENGANIWAHARKKNDEFENFLKEIS